MDDDRPIPWRGDSMPGCPRCGYPLAGVVSCWTDRCPLRHTCAECGLEIDLVRLLGRDQIPRWFVEAGRTPGGRLRRTPGTMVRLAVPFWPWRTLSIEDVRRLYRRGFPASWVTGLVLLVFGSIGVATVAEESSRIVKDLRGLAVMQSTSLDRLRAAIEAGWKPEDGVSSLGWRRSPPREVRLRNSEEVLARCRDPLSPWKLAVRLSIDRIRADWGLGGGGITYVSEVPIGNTRMRVGIRPGRDLKFPHVVTHFVAGECRLSVLWAHPVDLPIGPILTPAAGTTGWDRFLDRLSRQGLRLIEPLEPFRTSVLAILATPLLFLVLPTTRRRARLDGEILIRLAAFSLALPATLLCVMALADQPLLAEFREGFVDPDVSYGSRARRWAERTMLCFGMGSLVGFLWWWGACRMLRLPRPAAVAAAVFLIALLGAMVLLPPDFQLWMT